MREFIESNGISVTDIENELKRQRVEMSRPTITASLDGSAGLNNRIIVRRVVVEMARIKNCESLNKKISEIKQVSGLDIGITLLYNNSIIVNTNFKYFSISYLSSRNAYVLNSKQIAVDVDELIEEAAMMKKVLSILNS